MSLSRPLKLLLGLAAAGAGVLAFPFVRDAASRLRERRPLSAEAARALAEALARLCQSLPDDAWATGPWGPTWLPGPARALGLRSARLARQGAQLELASGLRHAGYRLEAASGAWVLTAFEEGAPDRELARLHLPPAEPLSLQALREQALANLEQSLAANAGDLSVHLDRLLFTLLRASPAQALEAVRNSVGHLPAEGNLQLALALLTHRAGDAARAERDLRAWVEGRPTFGHRALLAALFRLTDRADAALEALRPGLTGSLKSAPDDHLNPSAYAYDVAASLYAQGRWVGAAEVAKALQEREPDAYTRTRFDRPFRALRAAAALLQGQTETAQALVADGLEESDPFYRSADDALPGLARAVQAGDTVTVLAWRPADAGALERQAFRGVDLLQDG